MSNQAIEWRNSKSPWGEGWYAVARPGGQPEIARVTTDNLGSLRVWFMGSSTTCAVGEGDAERLDYIARVDPVAIRDMRPA
jgi:hypothetical protein